MNISWEWKRPPTFTSQPPAMTWCDSLIKLLLLSVPWLLLCKIGIVRFNAKIHPKHSSCVQHVSDHFYLHISCHTLDLKITQKVPGSEILKSNIWPQPSSSQQLESPAVSCLTLPWCPAPWVVHLVHTTSWLNLSLHPTLTIHQVNHSLGPLASSAPLPHGPEEPKQALNQPSAPGAALLSPSSCWRS